MSQWGECSDLPEDQNVEISGPDFCVSGISTTLLENPNYVECEEAFDGAQGEESDIENDSELGKEAEDEEEGEEDQEEEEEVDQEEEEQDEEDEEEEGEKEVSGDPIGSDDDPFENLSDIPLEGEEILTPLSPKEAVSFPEFIDVKCCKYLLKNETEFDDFFTPQKLLELTFIKTSLEVECIINELRNLAAIVDFFSGEFSDELKINILDSFIRNRHEVLSDKLLDCMNIDFEGTDVPFNHIFPISSRRTPDFIFNLEEGSKKYLILEVTAVSDVEKAAIRKGDEDKGYTSKYKREIDQLLALGFDITYIVVIFDVFDPLNNEHENSMSRLSVLMNKNFDVSKIRTLDFFKERILWYN